MRDIRFRAWDTKFKYMELWGDIAEVMLLGMLNPDSIADTYKRFNIMQYIGLKDKNGVEIYEGDVVKGIKAYGAGFSHKPGKTALFEVDGWLDGWGWRFNLKQITKLPPNYRAYPNFKDVEVVGNIWENPELLTTGNGMVATDPDTTLSSSNPPLSSPKQKGNNE